MAIDIIIFLKSGYLHYWATKGQHAYQTSSMYMVITTYLTSFHNSYTVCKIRAVCR